MVATTIHPLVAALDTHSNPLIQTIDNEKNQRLLTLFCRRIEFLDYYTKNDIPCYGGQMNILEFLDWVKSVNKLLEYLEVLDEKLVKMVV